MSFVYLRIKAVGRSATETAVAPVENKGVVRVKAIFMLTGEPKAHGNLYSAFVIKREFGEGGPSGPSRNVSPKGCPPARVAVSCISDSQQGVSKRRKRHNRRHRW